MTHRIVVYTFVSEIWNAEFIGQCVAKTDMEVYALLQRHNVTGIISDYSSDILPSVM